MVALINILLFIGLAYIMLILIASPNRGMRRVGVAVGLLILLPFWGLQNWHGFVKALMALAVLAPTIRLIISPYQIPAWMRQRWVIFVYFGCLMSLIFVWSVLAESPAYGFPALGVPAVVAAVCLFRKSWMERINPIAGRSNHA